MPTLDELLARVPQQRAASVETVDAAEGVMTVRAAPYDVEVEIGRGLWDYRTGISTW